MSATPRQLFNELLEVRKKHYKAAMAAHCPEQRTKITSACEEFYDKVIHLFLNEILALKPKSKTLTTIFDEQLKSLNSILQNTSYMSIAINEFIALLELNRALEPLLKQQQESDYPGESQAESKGSPRNLTESKTELKSDPVMIGIIRTLYDKTIPNAKFWIPQAKSELVDILTRIALDPGYGTGIPKEPEKAAAPAPREIRKKDPLDSFERVMLSIMIVLGGGVFLPLLAGFAQALCTKKGTDIATGNFLLCMGRQPGKTPEATPQRRSLSG